MTYDDTILATSGLVAYWPLSDISGTVATCLNNAAYNGTYNGGVTLWQAGPGGSKAALFDGSSGTYVTSEFPLDFSGTFSVELWAKTSTLSGTHALFGKDQDTGHFAVVCFIYNGLLYWGIKHYGDNYTTGASAATDWMHIVITADSSSYGRTYINGILVDGPVALAFRNNTGTFRIGYQLDNYWNSIVGLICRVAIYSTALDAATIGNHYTLGSTIPSAGLSPALIAALMEDGEL